MDKIEKIIKNTTENNQKNVNWTKAWSTKYPILKTYQYEVNIKKYSDEIRKLLNELQAEYKYSEQDAMLVSKDILYNVYLDKK